MMRLGLFMVAGLLISCNSGTKEALRNRQDRGSTVSSYAQPTSSSFGASNKPIPQNGQNEVQEYSGKIEIPIFLNKQREQIITHVGYSVSFNTATRLANWVAYELTNEKVQGTTPRARKFNQDPDVKGIQADNGDYKNSGWDKGHMCPAGDMKWSKQAMDESFYFTNICPQNPNLNGGDWKDLEEKCRALTQYYQKIYIACGAIIGKAQYGCIGHNRVTIPDGFYKVLLVETSTGFESIGFYFENKAGNRKLSFYARAVDEIEQLTGIDFFSTLPDSIENCVEAKYDLGIWHIK